jgi:hypothetical protein
LGKIWGGIARAGRNRVFGKQAGSAVDLGARVMLCIQRVLHNIRAIRRTALRQRRWLNHLILRTLLGDACSIALDRFTA